MPVAEQLRKATVYLEILIDLSIILTIFVKKSVQLQQDNIQQ